MSIVYVECFECFWRFQGVIQYRCLFFSGSVKLGEGRSFLGSCATSFLGMA